MILNRKIKISLVVASIISSLYAKDTKNLDSVTVTAQKMEENIQKVPMSINVVDEYLIEDKGIKETEDLTAVTPNLSFMNMGTAGIGSITMRGLHGDFHNFNTPAAIIVDGVPLLNGLGLNTSLFDIERVEVLKGPQGTLYGKNSEAGVINIITKQPTNELKGNVSLALGSDGKKELGGTISGPIVEDELYFGLAFRQMEKDGFIKNTYLNKTVGDEKETYGKINLRYTPSDNLDISFISSMIKYDSGDAFMGLVSEGNRIVKSDLEGFNKSKVYLNSLKIEYMMDDLLFESITAYKKFEDNAQQDWDLSNPTDTNYMYTYHERRPKDDYYTTLSEELRLSSTYGDLKWLTGLYLDKDKVNFYSQEIESSYLIYDPIESKSIGVFGHTTYNINDKLAISTGLRYDKEKREHKGYNQKEDYSAFSPKVALNYNLDETSMAYVNIAKGYRAGGFNTSASSRARNLNSFDQESLISYEVGMKNTFFDNKMLLNFALYYMDISDMQVKTAVSPYDGYTSNAGKSTSKGLELQLDYNLSSNLTFFSNLGINKTTFDDFIDNTFDAKGNLTGTVNYKGNENIYSPKYNYNVGLSYRGNSGFFARADLTGVGSMYTDKQNTNKVKAYELVDAKIGYETDSYEIYLYGKNIFDKEHDIIGYNNDFIIYSKPREIGVQLTYRF